MVHCIQLPIMTDISATQLRCNKVWKKLFYQFNRNYDYSLEACSKNKSHKLLNGTEKRLVLTHRLIHNIDYHLPPSRSQ